MERLMTSLGRLTLTAGILLAAPRAGATEPTPTPEVVTPVPPAPAPAPVAPAPYSLPWQLRPAAVGNVIRSDTSVAFYKNGDTSGSTVASLLLASYRVTPNLAPLLRVGVVHNSDPNPATGAGAALLNPILGVTAGGKLGGDLRLAAFLGGALPVGTGGDQAPAQNGPAAALGKGAAARSAMDNAMFAVNYLTAIAGVDAAWVAHSLTVQVEATVLQLFRTRNEAFAPESTRTNATAGLHLGWFVLPMLSLGGELRYQRWLSTPAMVRMNPAARDNTTFAIGPRFHFKVGGTTWLRPGISYAAAVDAPMSKASYSIVQVDVPVAF